MAEKVGDPQNPQMNIPPNQVPPPYMPNDPPPAYSQGPYPAAPGFVYDSRYPSAPPIQGYQAPIIGQPAAIGGRPPTVLTVMKIGQWGPFPMQITCPQCQARVMTETSASPGLLTWLLSGGLVFIGCWLGCCLIPCCIPECQDIEHHCPNCKTHLGTFRRI